MKFSDEVTFVMTIVGVLTIWHYLTGIRNNSEMNLSVLISGVMLCSISMALTFYVVVRRGKASVFALLSLLVLSYGLVTIYTFRYDALGGPDVIGEFAIASETYSKARWPIASQFLGTGDRAGRYASCLSVTILPAVLSKVTGLSVLDIFRYVMPSFGASVPILLFLVVKKVFNDERLAFLSALLLALSHLQIFMLSYMNREQVTNLFLMLSILMAIKPTQAQKMRNNTYPVITLVFLLSVVLSADGHAASDISLLVFVGFAVAPIFLKIRRKRLDTKYLFAGYFGFLALCQVAWMYFVSPIKYNQYLEIVPRIFNSLSLYLPNYLHRVSTTGQFLPSSSALQGGIPTSRVLGYWYYLSVIISGVGLLYALFRYQKDSRRTGIIVGGLLLFLAFGFSILATPIISELDPGRIFAEPFFYLFTAFTICIFCRRTLNRGPSRLLIVIPMIFIVASLPMNLSLPDSYRILHYNTENSVAPEYRATYFATTYSDLLFCRWLQSYVSPSLWISVDLKGYDIGYLAGHVNQTYQTYPRFSPLSELLIVPENYLLYDLWVIPNPYSIFPSQNVSVNELYSNASLIRSDGNTFMLKAFP